MKIPKIINLLQNFVPIERILLVLNEIPEHYQIEIKTFYDDKRFLHNIQCWKSHKFLEIEVF